MKSAYWVAVGSATLLAIITAGGVPVPARPANAGMWNADDERASAIVVRVSNARAEQLRVQLRNGTITKSSGVGSICAVEHLTCQAQVLTAGAGSSAPLVSTIPIGYGPQDLAAAYGLEHLPDGHGTVVVIGPGSDPNLAADLSTYRSTYGLPPCTSQSGCFRQVNYLGGPPYVPSTKTTKDKYREQGLATEQSLDVDMVSAACPGCHIVSMQIPFVDGFPNTIGQNDAAVRHIALGVATARSLGASAVSISYNYAGDTYTNTGKIAALMTQRGMAVVASSGDYGFNNFADQWPEGLPTVTSAGGTTLYPQRRTHGRQYAETVWEAAGSNCTLDLGPASGQPRTVSSLCNGHRASSDVSADSDPQTGVAIFDSYAPGSGQGPGFLVAGGTSASSPFIAGLYARGGHTSDVLGPNTLYTAARSAFHDITVGTNSYPGTCAQDDIGDAVCDAGPGWDGPTGRGTPDGLAAFRG
jgi:subtilase family serine protease